MTRMIAKTMMMTVMQKMPPKASFFRRLSRTFQSKLIGTSMTVKNYQCAALKATLKGKADLERQ